MELLNIRYRYECIKDCWLYIKGDTLLYVYDKLDNYSRYECACKKYCIKKGMALLIYKGQYIEVDNNLPYLTYTSVNDESIEEPRSVLVYIKCLKRI